MSLERPFGGSNSNVADTVNHAAHQMTQSALVIKFETKNFEVPLSELPVPKQCFVSARIGVFWMAKTILHEIGLFAVSHQLMRSVPGLANWLEENFKDGMNGGEDEDDRDPSVNPFRDWLYAEGHIDEDDVKKRQEVEGKRKAA